MTLAKGKNRKRGFFSFSRGMAVTLAKAKPCLSRKQNRDSRERKKNKMHFFAQIFFQKKLIEKLRKTGGKPKRQPPEKIRLKSRKRVRKKTKFGGSAQSVTRGERLRTRQVTLIVARLPKDHSLTSFSPVQGGSWCSSPGAMAGGAHVSAIPLLT